MPGKRHRILALWLRQVTEQTARLLNKLAERLDRTEFEARQPSDGDASSNKKGADPLPAEQIALGGVSSGPPADWLEKVRRGAPHLLRPQHKQAELPADVAEGSQPDLPPAVPVARAGAGDLNLIALVKGKPNFAHPPRTSEETVHRPPTLERKAAVTSAPPTVRRPA